jgi:6-phospho-beta-glucosidase
MRVEYTMGAKINIMQKEIIIAVIGGGGIFTPELVQYLCDNAGQMGKMEIRLMDIDEKRLEIVGGFCERLVEKQGSPVEISYAGTYEEAVSGADYVLLQFRVGGADSRIEDERLGKKYGIPFVETVSVCGFAAFLRTYYEMEKVAAAVLKLAPDAWVMNFSNPAGVLTEALSKLGMKKTVGICNASTSFIRYVKEILKTDDIYINWRGLNHFTVTDVVKTGGVNVFPKILDSLPEDHYHMPFDVEIIKNLGFIPNQYFKYYFFRDEIVEEQRQLVELRSETVKEINKELVELYRTAVTVPEELKKRGGYGYSHAVVDVIRSLECGGSDVHYIVIKNGGVLPGLPPDAFVEVPATVLNGEICAVPIEPLPEMIRGMMAGMKVYDQILIRGAMERSKRHLRNALLIHPLIGDWRMAGRILEDVLHKDARFLPEFK